MANRVDPLAAYGFKVTLSVAGVSGDGAMFQEVSGLGVNVEIQDIVEGGLNHTTRKIMGNATYPNLVFKRGLCSRDMFAWLSSYISSPVKERISGTIAILGDDNQPAMTYSFSGGLPVKWDGPQLGVGQNAIAMETLEIAHEGLRLA
ncbi:MAG: phage tail protein [Bradymonadales bacterium]|jgi:phage tail-like protein